MTEAEAKTKWCPFAQVMILARDKPSPGHNRMMVRESGQVTMNRDAAHCFGSACMAWRELPADEWSEKTPAGSGFCGLAGRP